MLKADSFKINPNQNWIVPTKPDYIFPFLMVLILPDAQ
jgi:hypothetical protein